MADPCIESWTASDGYVWQYRRFDPVGRISGEIVALHGIQSHGGWYLQSSEWLAEQGWVVSLLERRGCGLNEVGRGDAPSFRRLLDDVAEFMNSVKQRTNRPLILMGVSWGGKLALALQKRHRGICDGLVLVTPGFKPVVRPKLLARFGILFLRFALPTRLFPIPLNEPDLFTSNIERREFIRNDPAALRLATARLLFESRRLDVYNRLARKRVRVPTLLLLAGRDQIIDNRKTRKFLRRLDQLTIREYADAEHTLEFETAGPPHLTDLSHWLAKQIPADS